MRKSLIFASLCLTLGGVLESARAQSAPPLCGAGTWAVRSSRSATGWACSNQTPSDTPASDSSSSTSRHHRGSNGGFGNGYGAGGSQ
jgi:hypothetical protein